jgi:hypothetical protein
MHKGKPGGAPSACTRASARVGEPLADHGGRLHDSRQRLRPGDETPQAM